MSFVLIRKVKVNTRQTRFADPIVFEVTFESVQALPSPIEWKMVYVGSGESEKFDQTLACVMVGPAPAGLNRFVFEGGPPNIADIPQEELIDVTIVLLIGTYSDQEFVRVGYYIMNEHTGDPSTLDPEKIQRVFIEEETPRVTYFPIRWTETYTEIPQPGICDAETGETGQGETLKDCEN
ncbi:MAG: histone chaperone ASF1 [Amphiamblys sp. WSBS2006]|nr:MAG: histone chaperone ASF1 [Amphiamblys sp. WSBS2006]